jgi:hypothetical protein
MDGHPSLRSPCFGGRLDATIRPRPGAAKTLGARLAGRKRRFPCRCIRVAASHDPPPVETPPGSGGSGPDPQLWPTRPSAPCPSRGDPQRRPRLASPTSHLGGGTDPRGARRGPTPIRLAQPPDDPPLVPGRRTGTRPGRPAARGARRSRPAAPSDLADRRVRAHPLGRQGRGVLASDRRRGHRGRPEDGGFPPSASGPRSTRAPLRRR